MDLLYPVLGDDKIPARLVTSFATRKDEVDDFARAYIRQ
jgi:hypothetical protein